MKRSIDALTYGAFSHGAFTFSALMHFTLTLDAFMPGVHTLGALILGALTGMNRQRYQIYHLGHTKFMN